MSEQIARPHVQQALASVTAEMKGVGKDQHNKEQNYDFRGIDDMLKVLHPLLGKHGVVIVPDVAERLYEERVSNRGATGHCSHLHVRYRIYGPAGDFVEASTWGEGLDYGDKATNKAMTAAYKYLLFELFAISDPTEDPDRESPEGGKPRRAARAAEVSPEDQVKVDYLRDEVRRMLRDMATTYKPTKAEMEAAGSPEAVHALVLEAYTRFRADEDAALRGKEPGELPLQPGDEAPILVGCPRCAVKVPTGELAEHLGIEHEGEK